VTPLLAKKIKKFIIIYRTGIFDSHFAASYIIGVREGREIMSKEIAKQLTGGEMTNAEIAERLRDIAEYNLDSSNLKALADELDQPKPETGTVVWWRFRKDNEWQLGQVQEYNLLYSFGSDVDKEWADIEWKPARILADDEVAIPVEELIDVRKDISNGRYRDVSDWAKYYIDREEALRMERDG